MKRFLFFTLCCALSLSVAAQATRPVRGVVFDNNGIPMSGVTLTAVGSTDSKLSGTDGTFEMMVSPYTKLIEASKEGFISARAEVDGSYLVFKLQVDKKYAENKAKAEEEARLAAQKAEEAEQARIAAEKAAAEKAEQERLAAEERKRIEEERRIAAEKAAAEKAERERLAAEEKARIEAEKKRIAEEKARLAEEKRLALEKAKAEVKAIKSGEDDAIRQAQLEQERQKALAQQALLQEKAQKAEAKKARAEEWKQASLKGYRSMVEFAFMMDFDLMPSYNLHYIGGYQINNYLYVGAGVGVCLHESAFGDNAIAEWSQEPQEGTLPLQTVNVPVFAYFRANFINRRCTPYFAVAAGYRFSTKHYFNMPWDNQSEYYSTSGLLINPQLGVNLRMTKRADVYLAAGFNMQQMPMFNAGESTMFDAKFGKKFCYGFDLRLGFTF